MAFRLDIAGILALVALCFVSSISASPVPVPPVAEPSATPVVLTLSLCTPFVVLAAVKFSYLRYRRAQSIHTHAAPGPSLSECTETKASRMLGLGFDASVLYPTKSRFGLRVDVGSLAGYVVGCLGSPEWETRMRVRIDTAARKCRPPSSFIQSQSQAASPLLSASVRWSSQGSRTTTGGNRTSLSASRFSSSRSRSMSVSFLEMHSPNTNSSNADAHSRDGITDCSTVHPSSPPCSELRHAHGALLPTIPSEASRSNSKSGSTRSRRHASTSTLSPTLMQVMEPVIASWRQDSPKDKSSSSDSSNSHGHSPSMTPAFETPPTSPNVPSSPSSVGSVATARLTISVSGKQIAMSSPFLGRTHSLSASVHNGNLSIPAPAYSPDMSFKHSQIKISPSSMAQHNARSPLSPTVRALNVQVDRSQDKTPKTVPRNPLTAQDVSARSNDSWELGDLIRDGKLDIDAVSDILGLSNTSSPVTPAAHNGSFSSDHSSPSPRMTRGDISANSVLVRKCGGPLCAIPEETDDLSEDIGEASMTMDMRRPLSSLVERWGRACARESVDSAAVASEKGVGRVRESVSSSILNVDISLLGLDVSAITPAVPQEVRADDSDEGVEIWEEDRSWRENSSARNSIGWAC